MVRFLSRNAAEGAGNGQKRKINQKKFEKQMLFPRGYVIM
jgi:hypothetical protein